MAVIGWDVGGAHLKGARVEDGRLVAAVQVACPLWHGLDRLGTAFAEARQTLGDAPVSAVTMTGELSDIFPSRAAGVAGLCSEVARTLSGEIRVYAGAEGWLDIDAAPARVEAVASANWHASATIVARQRREALFADMGSTTTDLVPVFGGAVAVRGRTDRERLIAGELVYTGATRTFLMALAQRVPFKGVSTPVMNEYFASMADVYRILGQLPERADIHPAADNREKTFEASCARLARMVGADADEAEATEWRDLAAFYAKAQLALIREAAERVMSPTSVSEDAPLVIAGTGRFVLEKLAANLGRPAEHWEALVPVEARLAGVVSDCAPAVAVALLRATDRCRRTCESSP